MTRWILLIVGLAVLFLGRGNYWEYHWASKWGLLLAFFSLFVAHAVWRRVGIAAGCLTAYLLLSCLATGLPVAHFYHTLTDDVTLIALEHNALYAYIVLMAGTIVLIGFKDSWVVPAETALLATYVIGTLSVLCQGRGRPSMDGLYFGNPSMGLCLMATLLPFVWHWASSLMLRPRILIVASWIATAVAIWRTGTSIPVGLLGVSTAAYTLSRYKASKTVVGSLFILAFLMVLGGSLAIGPAFFDNNGRFSEWLLAMRWWHHYMPAFVGSGFGTAQIILPGIQGPGKDSYFLWLHNDWLQILLEGGWLGLGLAVATWAEFMRRAWKSPALFASLSAFTAMGLMNYPLRSPIHAFSLLLVVCLIGQSSRERPLALPPVLGCK